MALRRSLLGLSLIAGSFLIPAVSAMSSTLDEGTTSPFTSFLMAVSMIGVSEIGDKTFLIAALMAMRHPRWLVFSSAASSLALMTILSGVAGHTFVSFIPESYTKLLAGILFFVFGYKLTKEGLEMAKDAGVEEEMAEVEEELAVTDMNKDMNSIEMGRSSSSPAAAATTTSRFNFAELIDRTKNLASLVLSPIWVQIFAMNFLAEFGDRSQISIIAMASDSNYWYTIFGGCVGHFICTGFAVIGGKFLATKISMRTVTLGGAISFFIFGLLYVYEAFNA